MHAPPALLAAFAGMASARPVLRLASPGAAGRGRRGVDGHCWVAAGQVAACRGSELVVYKRGAGKPPATEQGASCGLQAFGCEQQHAERDYSVTGGAGQRTAAGSGMGWVLIGHIPEHHCTRCGGEVGAACNSRRGAECVGLHKSKCQGRGGEDMGVPAARRLLRQSPQAFATRTVIWVLKKGVAALGEPSITMGSAHVPGAVAEVMH